jgi:glycyl-tRNA synthetase (class II)
MFKTQQWVIDWEWKDIYLRPETAQWIFVNFKIS